MTDVEPVGRTRRPDGPDTVLYVSIPAGLGGSVRSLASVLEQHRGRVRRVVARRRETSVARHLTDHHLADVTLDLHAGQRDRAGRLTDSARLARWARSHRRRLLAVHANGLSELQLAAPAALAAGVPLVVWVHDWHYSRAARVTVPLLRLLPLELRWCTVSHHARERLVAAGLPGTAVVEMVPNPIDPTTFADPRPQETPLDPALTSPASTDGAVEVAYLGTPARYKGFTLLPDLIDTVQRTGVAVRWHVWSGPETMEPDTWHALHERAGDRVVLHPKVSDVGRAYAAADIVVCPSLEESFGRVAAEAMAAARPVVASDLPALREVLGDAGVFAPPGDVPALATAVADLVRDPQRRRSLGRAGELRAAHYEPVAIAEQLLHAYGFAPRGRALVVSHDASRTGAPRIAVEVASALADDGWDTVALVRWPGPLETDLAAATGRRVRRERVRRVRTVLRRYGANRWAATLERQAAARALDHLQPDLVWCNTVLSANVARAGLDHDLPVILHVHELGRVVPGVLRRYGLRERLDELTVVAASEAVATETATVGGIDPRSIPVIESAIDVTAVRARARPARGSPALPAGPLVGGCGEASHRKGVDLWLAMAAALHRTHPDVHFLWIGAHDDRPTAEATRLGLSPVVHFTGEVDDPAPLLAALRVFTLTSRADAFPLVVLEAMALARPVVAFDTTGVRRQLGPAGMLVPPEDPEALARAVAALLDDPVHARSLGEQAARRVEAHFDRGPFAERVQAVAHRALAGPSTAEPGSP
jgi:glycosyltransferase involved in cell wall biosynthesis